MNAILVGFAGLLINECVDVSPWLARLLVRWSARLKYPDPVRARLRAEDIEDFVGQCPAKLLALLSALGFLANALGTRLCRVVGAHAGDGAIGAIPGGDYVESLGTALREFADVRTLPRRRRSGHDKLVARLGELLRCPPEAIEPGVARHLLDSTVFASGVLVEDRNERSAAELLRLARDHVRRFPADDPVVLSVRHAGAFVLLQVGRADEAAPVLAEVHAARTRVLGPNHQDSMETGRQLAWAYAEQGRFADAEELLRGLAANGERQRLHIQCMLSWVLHRQGRYAESVAGYHEVIAGRAQCFQADHPDTLDARHSLAKVHYRHRDFQQALTEATRVHADRKRVCGSVHPDTLESRKIAVLAAFRLDRRTDRATRGLRRVLLRQLDRLGPQHPYTRQTVAVLADLADPDPGER